MSAKSRRDTPRLRPRASRLPIETMRSGSSKGRPRKRTAFTNVNTAALAPMPSASAMAATAVNHRSRPAHALQPRVDLGPGRHVREQAEGSRDEVEAEPRLKDAADRGNRCPAKQHGTERKRDHGRRETRVMARMRR